MKTGGRAWIAIFAVGVVALGLAVALIDPIRIGVDLLLHRGEQSVRLPARPPPKTLAEADLQDFADLGLLTGLDRSFTPETRAAFAAGVDALAARAGALSPAQRIMAVSRLVALAGNAHTTVDTVQRVSLFGRAPVRLAWFAEGLFVVRATGEARDLLGARIMAIDGRSPDDALAALRPYLSGSAERARIDSAPLLECPALLRVLWPETDGATLTVQLQTAHETVDRRLAAMAPQRDRAAAQPVLALAPPETGSEWSSALPAGPPLSLTAPARSLLTAPLEGDGLYVRINRDSDPDGGALADQLDRLMDSVAGDPRRWIALDLRFNHGGDPMATAAFARRLPDLLAPAGTLWILTGNATFSAAILTAARARHFVGDRARIVGEMVGDHARFWSDGGPPLVLRNSGIAIDHAYFAHEWAQGCRSPIICHPFDLFHSVGVPSLAPDIPLTWRFADYEAGRDTVLDRVTALSLAR